MTSAFSLFSFCLGPTSFLLAHIWGPEKGQIFRILDCSLFWGDLFTRKWSQVGITSKGKKQSQGKLGLQIYCFFFGTLREFYDQCEVQFSKAYASVCKLGHWREKYQLHLHPSWGFYLYGLVEKNILDQHLCFVYCVSWHDEALNCAWKVVEGARLFSEGSFWTLRSEILCHQNTMLSVAVRVDPNDRQGRLRTSSQK